MTSNPRIIFARIPEGGLAGLPIIGKDLVYEKSATIDLDRVPLNGGFLTKTVFLSPEAAIRARMRDPAAASYTTPFIVGAPVIGFGLVEVLRSEKQGVNVGDYMYGQTPWEAYTVQPYTEGRINFKAEEWPAHTFDMDTLALQVVPNPGDAFPLTCYASVLGTPGLTAYVGFEGLITAHAYEGQTIFVSSGASALGSLVIQLAKAKGMRVVASAGSNIKVDYMKSVGADVAFNYKTQGYTDPLSRSGPIHWYWDNVGGEAFEAALEALAFHGNVVCCGTSGDNTVAFKDRYGVKNISLVFMKRITIKGFLVPDFIPQFAGKFFAEMPALLAQGKIKSREHITHGLENASQALVDYVLKAGVEVAGKPVVMVATE
ncbi:hypothetical protein C8J56DRAFT_1169228 [Mycena floridula]|nr:hypothetical protein C8J56DRAFT_1169228 [Mycena floridula]